MSHALQINNGFFDPSALRWTVASALLGAAAFAVRFRPGLGRQLPGIVLFAGVLWGLVEHATTDPGLLLPRSPDRWFYGFLTLAAASVLLIGCDPRRARRAWFPLALAVYAALGVWMVLLTPRPFIDVYTVYYKALHVLRAGGSPYSITFQNIYASTDFYAESAVTGNTVNFGFPYPPLALLMALPGIALGDLRYAMVGAVVIGAAAIGYTGRSRTALLAATLLLFTPRGLFVIEESWSEPLVVCWLGLLVYASINRESTWVKLGGLLAVKQHLVVALPFSGWLRHDLEPRRRTREVVLACVAAAAVTLPFFVADPSGFWRSVVALQFKEPFRWDSLSLLVPIAKSGYQMSPEMLVALPLAALGLSSAFAWWRGPRDAAGFSAALGLVLIAIFLVGKKAFCNYYFLVLACWCAAVAAAERSNPPVAEFS